jgi:hypothetical protein
MKKLVLSATFMLASFGAFAANSEVKSNKVVLPVKNNIELAKVEYKKHPVMCTVGVSYIIEFSITWCCANCD